MRVIAGEAKGRRLFSVPGETTRPITDRVKSALFNILGESVVEASFLDLFAGTGGVGIEALSRGAAAATFVERDQRALATIRRNLSATGLADRARVVRSDVFKFIAAAQSQPYDIIYVAPPQYQGLWARTVLALDPSPLLAQGTLVVAQIFPKEYATLTLQRLVLTDQRKYGSTLLCFYDAQS
jgi:16S rRNA (guanine(966)-N(2))-methyltransferase RsmD